MRDIIVAIIAGLALAIILWLAGAFKKVIINDPVRAEVAQRLREDNVFRTLLAIDERLRGPQGIEGKKGDKGDRGPRGPRGDSQTAILYTRWGRNDCPDGATEIYDGFVAGHFHTHPGSGANLLCLALDPTWSADFDDGNQDGALLYGAQYQTLGRGIASFVNLHGFQVPCAVCMRDGAKVSFMLPGRDMCPTGFTQEYPGYIMATAFASGHSASEYICVDQEAIAVGSNPPPNGPFATLYPTEFECTSTFECPPYVANREITCSVCSQ